MTEWIHYAALAEIGLSVVIFVALLFINAPYGRHSGGKQLSVSGRVGWLLMEAPSPLLVGACFLLSDLPRTPVHWLFLAMWQVHYIHRAFIFPFRMSGQSKPMPVAIAAGAAAYNVFNGGLVGLGLFVYPAPWVTSSLEDPKLWIGMAVFLAGLVLNLHSDTVLLHLRKPGETGYKIPRGGFYRFVSAPNYLGEIVEWLGFALATWSLPALGFACLTIANLAPRAFANHRWYRSKFPEYPPERKALIPFVL